MYTIKRISKVPGSPIRVAVDAPPPDGEDGGFQQGGVFVFEPKGKDGDTHQLGLHAAQAIMYDPTLADHFEATPDVPKVKKAERPPEPGTPVPAAEPEPAPTDVEPRVGARTTAAKAAGGKSGNGHKKH